MAANIKQSENEAQTNLSFDALREVGVNPDNLKKTDLDNIQAGKKTELLNVSIPDNQANRELLKNEKVQYKTEDGKLHFEGKIAGLKYLTADNLPETKTALKKSEIDFKEEGKKIRIEGINLRKLAIATIIVVSPVTGLALLMIPKRGEVKNDLGLTAKEIKALKEGHLLSRADKNNERSLMQLDKDTNELVRVRARDINIPDRIGGEKLSPAQKEALRNGREVTIITADNKSATVKLDLNSPSGIYVQGSDKTQEIKNSQTISEKEKQTVHPSNITDEKQRLEHIAQNGIKGIDNIFSGKDTEKQMFLEKNNMIKDYQEHKKLDGDYSRNLMADNNSSMKEISNRQNSINDTIKSTALSQMESLGKTYGNSYGAKNETKAGIKL